MSHDPSIRTVTVAENAEAAARRYNETGTPEPNPYAGTPDEKLWFSVYHRWILALSAAEGTEGGA